MSLSKLTDDLNIVQGLDDEPNDIGGLSPSELKAKFDEAGNSIKTYINETLLPALESLGVEAITQYASSGMKYLRLNADGAIEASADGVTYTVTASSGHIVYDKTGTQMPQRTRMKFANSIVTDDGTYTIINGIKGDTGATGATGATGRTATITIGTVTTGAEGSSVIFQNVGTTNDAIWNITIPKGDKGAAWYPALDGLGNLTFALSDTATPPPIYNIRGPQGPQGVQGAQGATGAQGQQGIQGIQGAQGPQGIQGATGPQGAIGPAGPQGAQGPQGEKGDDGADGSSFGVKSLYATLLALQTAHPTGTAGDAYAVGTATDNTIYIWNVDTSSWTDVGALQGPQGPQGPTGAQGPMGPQGDTGAQGPQGIQGIQGEQGPTGPQGEQGIQGPAGADGQSAYESAVASGYSGTETAFNASLAGIDNKADKKVPSATGNFAALNATGNLADSGKKAADFAAATHAHTKSQITDFPTSMTPTAHKSTHSIGGSDALKTTDLGLDPTTAAKYFESPVGTESVDQVLSLLADKGFKLLASFTAAGTVTFTVPVGVTRIFSLQIGGGASGGAASYNISGQTTRYNSASGGTSGVVKTAFADVTPGEIISGVVGAGGAAVSATTASSAGNSGGTTSFNGITTSGGAGGYAVAYSLWNSGVGCAQGAMLDGAQGSEFGKSFVNAQTPYFFARVRTYVSTLNDVNLKYIESMIRQIVASPNALKTHVAAGGSGYITRNDSGIYLSESQSAITFSDSKTATSGAAISTTTNAGATAVSGSDPGCGGGAAVANGGVAMSAAGCDGAIFVFGVSA